MDGWSTLENLESLKTFAQNAGRLLIIMMDHGYRTDSFTTFQMNQSQQLLSTTLDNWLDYLQANHDIDITLVVDACYSGGFVEDCQGGVRGW